MNRRYAVWACLLAGSVIGERPSAAQDPVVPKSKVIDVWPAGEMPGNRTREPETRHSPERTDAVRITNVSAPTLTWFPVEGRAPAVIVCPGGGYSYVVFDKEGSEIAKWLNSIGFHALVLKYRNPRNRAGALQDLQRSLSLARAKADSWEFDPQRIGVIGFSAGGHLCAQAGTRFSERTYAAIDRIDRQHCRPDFAILVYPAYLERKGKVAPELNLDAKLPKLPPTLIVHNEDDVRFVRGSKVFAAALERRKQPHQLLLYPTGGHGYGLRCERAAKAWPEDTRKWLQKRQILQ